MVVCSVVVLPLGCKHGGVAGIWYVAYTQRERCRQTWRYEKAHSVCKFFVDADSFVCYTRGLQSFSVTGWLLHKQACLHTYALSVTLRQQFSHPLTLHGICTCPICIVTVIVTPGGLLVLQICTFFQAVRVCMRLCFIDWLADIRMLKSHVHIGLCAIDYQYSLQYTCSWIGLHL